MSAERDRLTIDQSLEYLADGLVQKRRVYMGGFFEFVRDIWSQGYEHPEYFKVWHVELICNDVERALSDGKNYVAVLPRIHFKSTVLGHAFSVWRLLTALELDAGILYLSYSDGMAQKHIGEIKKRTRRNPFLQEIMKDKSPQSDYSFRYMVGRRSVEIEHGGLFSFKRGLHVSGAMVADDILRDPDNPLNLTQLSKVEEHFLTESMFIPNKGTPTIVLGTPMMPEDLLSKLRSDERFYSRVLPALDPVPGRRVLMPELYNEEWLLSQKKNHPRSFASEFMLTPLSVVDAFVEASTLEKLENSALQNLNPTSKHEFQSDYTVAGFDVGKKRHPSHLSIFRSEGGKMIQICQMFLDNWPYTRQVALLNSAVENFDIDKAYLDNSRGELEERSLDPVWLPMTFTAKSKRKMANKFEEFILQDRIEFIRNERQKSQILSVSIELEAPETPMGHGDAFWSNALAALAFSEGQEQLHVDLGDMQFLGSLGQTQEEDDVAKVLSRTLWKEPQRRGLPCPSCGEIGGFIEENGLCLLCLNRAPV